MMKEMIYILNGHFKRKIVDLSVSLQKLLYDSFFLIVCPYTLDTMNSYKIILM